MRNFFILIILIFIVVIIGCRPKPDNAIIQFKNKTINIGHIAHDAKPVNVKFGFVNDGGKILQLNNVVSDCTCTVINFTKKNIAPGDSGTIDVKLDPKLISAKGHFERPVVVRSNTNPRLHTLIIKMFVER